MTSTANELHTHLPLNKPADSPFPNPSSMPPLQSLCGALCLSEWHQDFSGLSPTPKSGSHLRFLTPSFTSPMTLV